jgi:hypothetical protein
LILRFLIPAALSPVPLFFRPSVSPLPFGFQVTIHAFPDPNLMIMPMVVITKGLLLGFLEKVP